MSKVQKLLAGTDEHEPTVNTPDTIRAVTARVEPQVTVIAPHVEQAEDAIRVGNRLHADNQPLSLGLVFVYETQFGTDLIRAELQAFFLGPIEDIVERGFLETQLGDTNNDQIHFRFLGGHAEGGVAEDAVGVVTDPHLVIFEVTAEAIGICRTDTELDGLEDLELGGRSIGRRIETCQELFERPGVFNPPLHDVFRDFREILQDRSYELVGLGLDTHGVFSFQGVRHCLA